MSEGRNNARMIDWDLFLRAGIDPKTGRPCREGAGIADGINAILRVQDEQDAVSRFKWYRFPGLTSQEVERLIYYKGNLAFWYFEEFDQFMFLPYALQGTIDLLGRYNAIKPLPFGATNESEDKSNAKGESRRREEKLATLLATKKLTVVKEPMTPEEVKTGDFKRQGAVLLWDYTPQLKQTIMPRQILNDPLVRLEAECLPYMATALAHATGVEGLRVEDEDGQREAMEMSKQVRNAALNGVRYIPVLSRLEMQELASGTVGKSEEFLLAMQALDNLRLGTHGIENGGLFQKKAHELQAENEMNQGSRRSVLVDCLNNRRRFCDIVNSIWGLNVWVEINDEATEEEEQQEEQEEGPGPGEREEGNDNELL
ncbi:MAG: hypothetical protein IKY18_03620 [Oscillospiraceae bacterium]|nr:hypothetical protein [Oscillospiraceae bacterium]